MIFFSSFLSPSIIWAKECFSDTVRLPTAAGVRSVQKGAGGVSGVNSELNPASLFLVAAFLSALIHRAAIAASLFARLWLVRGASRNWLPGVQATPSGAGPQGRPR
jgi:hypothetical protein